MNSGTQKNNNNQINEGETATDNGGVQVVVNPYNFNNRMITEGDIKTVLQKYDIVDNIVNYKFYYIRRAKILFSVTSLFPKPRSNY